MITQGADGDFFYVVEKGTLDCYVKKPGDGRDSAVETCNPASVFDLLPKACPKIDKRLQAGNAVGGEVSSDDTVSMKAKLLKQISSFKHQPSHEASSSTDLPTKPLDDANDEEGSIE